jgi:hypothetical protein
VAETLVGEECERYTAIEAFDGEELDEGTETAIGNYRVSYLLPHLIEYADCQSSSAVGTSLIR